MSKPEREPCSKKQDLTARAITFTLSLAVVAALCLFHGFSAGQRNNQIIDEMFANGNVTGKFWKVTKAEDGQVMVRKYHRTIPLEFSYEEDVQLGDNVSFIAKRIESKPRPQGWHLLKVRIHGTSLLKYVLSFISVLFVLGMCFRHLRLDMKSLSVRFKEKAADA
jgi:hypothetical protein